MVGFKTGMQALVSNALAVAVTGKLIDYARNLGGQLVGMHLVRKLELLAHPLVCRQDRQQLAWHRRPGIVRRNLVSLCDGDHGQHTDQRKSMDFFMNATSALILAEIGSPVSGEKPAVVLPMLGAAARDW